MTCKCKKCKKPKDENLQVIDHALYPKDYLESVIDEWVKRGIIN